MSSRNKEMRQIAEQLALRTQQNETRRREVQKQYQEQATELVQRYHRECEQQRPQAQEAFSQVILPWWSDLQASGLADQLNGILRHRPSALPASNEVAFFWPDEALRELQQGEDAYSWVLSGDQLLAGSGMPGIELREKLRVRNWRSQLLLSGGDQGLTALLSRVIEGGRGMAAGYLHHSLRLPLTLSPGSTLPDIHPQVLVELAQQIESGVVEQRVCTSLLELR